MNILSLNTNNSNSFEEVNKKNKTISIILVICITIALLAGLYNYTIILGLNEDISLLESTNIELTDRIDLLESTNIELADTILELNEDIYLLERKSTELAAEIDVFSNQQKSYDFLLFYRFDDTATKNYVLQSGVGGNEEMNTPSLSEALKYASNKGKIVKFKSGTYDLDADVIFDSKSNLILDGQKSNLILHDHLILFVSDHYEKNYNNQIRNFNLINGTLKIENGFMNTIADMTFIDCESAIEVLNTNTWTEYTKVENVYFINCQMCITFKTPAGIDATGSYESTVLDRCSFNLYRNNSVAIMVEKDAEVSNGQLNNMRIWMYANNNQTQTGLHVEGKMTNTIQSGVVFESFGNGTIYGVYLGKNSTAFSDEGTTFLGKFTARIKNPDNKWLPGVFRKDPLNLTFFKSTTITTEPFTIQSFNAILNITNISPSEQVTVRITLNFIDHTSESILLNFSENQTYELTDQNLFDLYPSQNTIWNIEFRAQTNLLNSETNVSVKVFGTAS